MFEAESHLGAGKRVSFAISPSPPPPGNMLLFFLLVEIFKKE